MFVFSVDSSLDFHLAIAYLGDLPLLYMVVRDVKLRYTLIPAPVCWDLKGESPYRSRGLQHLGNWPP